MIRYKKEIGIAAQVIHLLASIVTLGSFLYLVWGGSTAFVPGEFTSQENIKPAFGSWLSALVLSILLSVLFGIAFASLIVLLDTILGSISLVVATPAVGLISGFQSGALALVLASLFEIRAGVSLLMFLTLTFSCIIETVFILRICEKRLPESVILFDDVRISGRSLAMSSINISFFSLGAYLLLIDAVMIEKLGFGFFWSFIFFMLLGAIYFFLSIFLFRILKEE